MSAGLRANNVAPEGERPADQIRGRVGIAVAGVGTIVGSPIASASPADGDVLVYDAASDSWIFVNSDSLGDFLTRTLGEQAAVDTQTGVSGAVTIDCSLANLFDLTLTGSITLTITNPPPTGVASTIVIIVRQGGTGSYTVTYPAAVKWQAADGTATGSAPTLFTAVGAEDVIELGSLDGGVTWGAARLTGSELTFATPAIVLGTAAAAGAASSVIRSDATIVAFDTTAPDDVAAVGVASSAGSVAKAARRDHGHALTYHDEPLTDGASNFIFDGGDIIVVTGVPNA